MHARVGHGTPSSPQPPSRPALLWCCHSSAIRHPRPAHRQLVLSPPSVALPPPSPDPDVTCNEGYGGSAQSAHLRTWPNEQTPPRSPLSAGACHCTTVNAHLGAGQSCKSASSHGNTHPAVSRQVQRYASLRGDCCSPSKPPEAAGPIATPPGVISVICPAKIISTPEPTAQPQPSSTQTLPPQPHTRTQHHERPRTKQPPQVGHPKLRSLAHRRSRCRPAARPDRCRGPATPRHWHVRPLRCPTHAREHAGHPERGSRTRAQDDRIRQLRAAHREPGQCKQHRELGPVDAPGPTTREQRIRTEILRCVVLRHCCTKQYQDARATSCCRRYSHIGSHGHFRC